MKLPGKAATLEKRLGKMGVVTLLGIGFFLFVMKSVAKRTWI